MAAGSAVCGYWIVFGWMAYRSPLAYDEMDFNRDGHVSFSEAGYASSFGVRTIAEKGRHCTEYFAYKDGVPLKRVCQTGH